jgi:hypothetical protein
MADHALQGDFAEDLGDEAEFLEYDDSAAVADRDTGCLLPTVLERVQTVVREFRHVLTGCPHPEHPARIPRTRVVVDIEINADLAGPPPPRRVHSVRTAQPSRGVEPSGGCGRAHPVAHVGHHISSVHGRATKMSGMPGMS